MRFASAILTAILLTATCQSQTFTINYSSASLSGTPASLPVTASTAPAPLTASSVTRSSDLVAQPVGTTPTFNSSNFPLVNTVSSGVGYLTVTLNPNGGVIDLNSVTFLVNRDIRGPKDVFLRSSLDLFAANLAFLTNLNPNSTGTALTVTGLSGAFDTITTPIEFRVYGVAATNSTGLLGVLDTGGQSAVTITGGFTPVPEPAAVGLLAAAGLGLVGLYRKRVGLSLLQREKSRET